MSCASSPTARVACGWCGPSRSRPTRTGSNSIATSTWTICANTKRRCCGARHDRHPPDPPEPGAVLAAVQTAARRLRRWPVASLDCGCARRHPEPRSGRRNGPRGRTKKLRPLPDLFAEFSRRDCFNIMEVGEPQVYLRCYLVVRNHILATRFTERKLSLVLSHGL